MGEVAVGAHPRSRGENGRVHAGSGPRAGSSPLTRGKLMFTVRDPRRPRLIPAHAGKTVVSVDMRCCVPAHPRSRGENLRVVEIDSQPWGSSPLTRGKRRDHRRPAAPHRLIPAHAGKTRGRYQRPPRYTAHPRSRGENAASITNGSLSLGSSPLTRGKHPAVDDGDRREGGSSPLTRGKQPYE